MCRDRLGVVDVDGCGTDVCIYSVQNLAQLPLTQVRKESKPSHSKAFYALEPRPARKTGHERPPLGVFASMPPRG